MNRRVFSFTILSAASTSDSVDLGAGAWQNVCVQVGTMSTGVNLGIQASVDGGTTFYNLHHRTLQSATVATPVLYISGLVGTNGGVVAVPELAGVNHIRFVGTGTIGGGATIKVICAE